jgi:hypothetical protein
MTYSDLKHLAAAALAATALAAQAQGDPRGA